MSTTTPPYVGMSDDDDTDCSSTLYAQCEWALAAGYPERSPNIGDVVFETWLIAKAKHFCRDTRRRLPRGSVDEQIAYAKAAIVIARAQNMLTPPPPIPGLFCIYDPQEDVVGDYSDWPARGADEDEQIRCLASVYVAEPDHWTWKKL